MLTSTKSEFFPLVYLDAHTFLLHLPCIIQGMISLCVCNFRTPLQTVEKVIKLPRLRNGDPLKVKKKKELLEEIIHSKLIDTWHRHHHTFKSSFGRRE